MINSDVTNKNYTHSPPTICLNMIVKNESLVIERLLNSVVNVIDTYCIEDTGSTDNTIELITQFFNKRGINGKIVNEPFLNFAYNRTHAFQQAEGMSDYLLLIDADMIFTHSISINQIREKLLKHDVFHVFQGSSTFYYKNVRFAKNVPTSKYITPTHEYFCPPDNSTYGIFEKSEIFIDDKGDGGSKQHKFARDIQLLSAELETKGETDPGADRCMFYLANSYRDAGNVAKAIECYKKRVTIGGWEEEVWQSLYYLGNLHKEIGETEKAVFYWLEAYEKQPKRVENLYKIIEYYRNKEQYKIALFFWKLADNLRKTHTNWSEYLFLQSDIYEYLLDYEYSILGYYTGCNHDELSKSIIKVISHPSVTNSTFDTCLKNYKFYTPILINLHSGDGKQTIVNGNMGFVSVKNLELLRSIGKNRMKTELENRTFFTSTPSITLIDEETMIVCVRFVNYSISSKGEYINQKNIITKNVIAVIDMLDRDEWKLKFEEQILKYDETVDCLYVGLEDVRIFSYLTKENKNVVLYNANRGLSYDKMVIEHGEIDVFNTSTLNSGVLTRLTDVLKTNKRDIEKNWVLFDDNRGIVKCIYSWNPLIIGEIDSINHVFNEVYHGTNSAICSIPKFFERVRGSSNGVSIPETNNEVWFLCHMVSYEDRRRYYHLFIVLNKTTYRVVKYTRLFTFCKDCVEYSTGFVYMKETREFLIGFSIMDSTSDYIVVSKDTIDDLMDRN